MNANLSVKTQGENLLFEHVFGQHGFYQNLQLKAPELATLRNIVAKQWRDCVLRCLPEQAEAITDYAMPNYHELLAAYPSLDHKTMWPKKNRILAPADVHIIRQLPFMQWLAEYCGEFLIANEEGLHDEEIYWRLARPSNNNDVGPMHADKWFWDLGHGNMPPNYQRIKIWIPLYCETGVNGLKYVPQSHRQSWAYSGIERDGFVKPQIDVAESDLNIQAFHTQAGQAVIFNDELLHGGLVGGEQSRVSIEFTILVPIAKCQNYIG